MMMYSKEENSSEFDFLVMPITPFIEFLYHTFVNPLYAFHIKIFTIMQITMIQKITMGIA